MLPGKYRLALGCEGKPNYKEFTLLSKSEYEACLYGRTNTFNGGFDKSCSAYDGKRLFETTAYFKIKHVFFNHSVFHSSDGYIILEKFE